jgi:hypothetical protein
MDSSVSGRLGEKKVKVKKGEKRDFFPADEVYCKGTV